MTTIDIHDVPGGLRVGVKLAHVGDTEIPINDAVVALEDLARILGYSLVDRYERQEIASLLAEVDHHEDVGSNGYRLAVEALALAVDSALRITEER